MIRSTCVFLAVVFLFSFMVALAETTTTGILVDAACAGRMGADDAKAANHKVACALMPNCQASGFGIVVGGKFLKFDKAGDEKALALLEGAEETLSFKVTVTGDVDGENIAVQSISKAN